MARFTAVSEIPKTAYHYFGALTPTRGKKVNIMANRQTKVSSTKKTTKAKSSSSFHSKPAKKAKAPKPQKRDEFRNNKKSGHPAYIYQRVGNEFKFLGLTHAKISRGVKNIPLESNPNPNDSSKSYVKPISERQKTTSFKSVNRGWRFSDKDKKKVERYKK